MEPEVNEPLSRALKAMAEDDATLSASASVEAQLLEDVRATGRVRLRAVALVGLAAAAVLAIGAAVVMRQAFGRDETARVAPAPAATSIQATAVPVTDFFALGYSDVPAFGTQIVRIEVPRSALKSFGVTPIELGGPASSTVPADVLVGDDGLARAVRFVSVARIEETR
jgi:hypothetical protein